MSEKYIICNNCGARCDINDTYCRTCSQNLSNSSHIDENEQIIDGIENEELEKYIGKHAKKYMNCFAKRKGKWFLQFNLWAFVFGSNWFFYRKMRKIAILYVAAVTLLSCLLQVVVAFAFMDEFERYIDAKADYDEYMTAYHNGEVEMFINSGKLVPEYKAISDEYSDAQKTVKWIGRLVTIPVFIVNILVRLLADCLYKQHIKKYYYCTTGGTSLMLAFGGGIMMNILSALIEWAMLLIPAVAVLVLGG